MHECECIKNLTLNTICLLNQLKYAQLIYDISYLTYDQNFIKLNNLI